VPYKVLRCYGRVNSSVSTSSANACETEDLTPGSRSKSRSEASGGFVPYLRRCSPPRLGYLFPVETADVTPCWAILNTRDVPQHVTVRVMKAPLMG
jgi:hypothetical protein